MRIARIALAVVVGYLLSATSSILWFLVLTHRPPHEPQPIGYMAATAVYGIVFSLLAGFVARKIAGELAYGAALGVAILILAASVWSYAETPGQAHWSQLVAVFLMAPSAWAGGTWSRRGAYNLTQA